MNVKIVESSVTPISVVVSCPESLPPAGTARHRDDEGVPQTPHQGGARLRHQSPDEGTGMYLNSSWLHCTALKTSQMKHVSSKYRLLANSAYGFVIICALDNSTLIG